MHRKPLQDQTTEGRTDAFVKNTRLTTDRDDARDGQGVAQDHIPRRVAHHLTHSPAAASSSSGGSCRSYETATPHLIEPGLTVEAARFDDERVAIPSADRLSHPRIHRRGCGTGHVDVANRARVFVRKEDDL